MHGGFGMSVMVITATVSFLAGAMIVSLVERRRRMKMALLMHRLARFETSGSIAAEACPAEVSDPQPEGSSGRAPEPRSTAVDPLAGKTSHVRRIVQGVTDPDCLADEAILCIAARVKETYTPAQLADDLTVSLRSLERGLSISLGCTPGRLIQAMKMREARRLLLGGRYRVNEVARQLDFSSQAYFTRRFKSFYGITPGKLAARAPEPS